MRKLLNLSIAAESLGILPDVLRVQIHRGKLKGEKLGRDWFVTEQEVERYRIESLRTPRFRGTLPDGTEK